MYRFGQKKYSEKSEPFFYDCTKFELNLDS